MSNNRIIVLGTNIAFLTRTKLLLQPNQLKTHFIDVVFGILLTLPIFTVTIGCTAYFVVYIDQVVKMTNALYVMCASSMYIIVYWMFATRKNACRDIVIELQSIVDLRM